MDRKLASIQIIKAVNNIPDADRISVCDVLGWKAVTRKDEYKVGDKIIYVECDSLLPSAPWSEFLKDKNNPDKPIRIKTCRLRKQLSQGVIFPLSILPEGTYNEGDEVTGLLGITKWELPVPACMAGQIKRQFPTGLGIHKSDELRVQSYPEVVNEFKGKQVYISLKCDGTSGTFIHFNGEIDVCSRNLSLVEGGNVYWEVFKKYDLERILKEAGNYGLQGEVVGSGLQCNRMGITGHSLFVFNVYSFDEQRYLNFPELKCFCEKWGLTMVPILYVGVFDSSIDSLIDMANNTKYSNGDSAEGIVIRTVAEQYSEVLQGRSSFKVISNEYLLKNSE